MDDNDYYRREWLNRPGFHAGAYVIAEVERHRPERGVAWVDGTLVVADCARVVTLDFRAYDDETRAQDVGNALHKARLLRDVVAEYTGALEDACGWLGTVRVHPGQEALPILRR